MIPQLDRQCGPFRAPDAHPHPQPESGSRHHSDWDPDPHCHFDAHTLADRIAYADVCAVALSDEHSAAFSAHPKRDLDSKVLPRPSPTRISTRTLEST